MSSGTPRTGLVTIDPLEPRLCLSAAAEPTVFSVESLSVLASAAATDGRSGDLLIAGGLPASADFDPRPATFLSVGPKGIWSPFVAKYAPDGAPRWALTFDVGKAVGGLEEAGGGAADAINITAVAAGPDGSVYIAGRFAGTIAFDAKGDHPLTTTPAGDGVAAHAQDVFLVKFDAAGKYRWGRLVSGIVTGAESAGGLAVDRFGNAYLAGVDPAAAPADAASFLTKFTTDGDRLWTASGLRGTASAVSVDRYDSPWVAVGGATLRLYQFDARRGRLAAKIGAAAPDNSAGHGPGAVFARSVAFSPKDEIVLAGDFTRTFDFAPGKQQLLLGDKRYDPAGHSNVFVSKLRADGASAVFAFAIGGGQTDRAAGAAVDRKTGDVLVGGTYAGVVDFDPARAAATTRDAGTIGDAGNPLPTDVFFARYSATGRFRAVASHPTPNYDDTPAGFGLTPTAAYVGSWGFYHHVDFRDFELSLWPLT